MAGKKMSKQVNVYDRNNNFIGTFDSASKAKEYIDKKYNINLCISNISAVCTGRYRQHKGFIFKYVQKGI